jgi:AraC-like DNA-binding protein
LFFSGTAFFAIAVKFLNYAYEFELVRPVIAAELAEVSSGGQRSVRSAALGAPRYRKSKLAGLNVDTLHRRLEEYMVTAKPYLDPELTIESLGQELGLPSHQLSELINERLDMNFRNYVNSFRIEEVKRLLAERKDINILEAAFESGFNSKGTFNMVFLKSTGKSPREWRRGSRDAAVAG